MQEIQRNTRDRKINKTKKPKNGKKNLQKTNHTSKKEWEAKIKEQIRKVSLGYFHNISPMRVIPSNSQETTTALI